MGGFFIQIFKHSAFLEGSLGSRPGLGFELRKEHGQGPSNKR